jgi:hypothetical protein
VNIFVCPKHNAVITSYGRGHAVKQLAKALEKQGKTLDKKDAVVKLDVDKAQVVLMEGTNEVLSLRK